METRIQIVAILVAAGVFGLVFELVRRRRLMERYALIWLVSAVVLVVLAALQSVLLWFAHLVGVFYAPSALFAVGLGFAMLLLLHFSLVISRLADQNKVLAQRLGRLQQQVDELQLERSLERADELPEAFVPQHERLRRG